MNIDLSIFLCTTINWIERTSIFSILFLYQISIAYIINSCSRWEGFKTKKTHRCLLNAQADDMARPQGVFLVFYTPDSNSCHLEQTYFLFTERTSQMISKQVDIVCLEHILYNNKSIAITFILIYANLYMYNIYLWSLLKFIECCLGSRKIV